MNLLFIGGTGEISYECLRACAQAGHRCSVFNRGRREEPLPETVRQITGDCGDAGSYDQLARETFDVVCQFIAYSPADIERDARVFAGRVGQYVFISTASAYQKPPRSHVITESTPLENPFWAYSQQKALAEKRLGELKLPATVVRPSHTLRIRFPGTFVSGDVIAGRMERGKPVIVPGDGTSIWTLTSAADFAASFIRLLGEPRAIGQAFHIATGVVHTWDQITQTMAKVLGAEAQIVHVPSDTLVRYEPEWRGRLFGDKMWPTTFDHAKLAAIVGELPKPPPLLETFRSIVPHYRNRTRGTSPDHQLESLLDRIIADQQRLGARP